MKILLTFGLIWGVILGAILCVWNARDGNTMWSVICGLGTIYYAFGIWLWWRKDA